MRKCFEKSFPFHSRNVDAIETTTEDYYTRYFQRLIEKVKLLLCMRIIRVSQKCTDNRAVDQHATHSIDLLHFSSCAVD